ncbi:hypothetical protein [Brachybacterium tyrofermentans]|uniref:hypothetical protein n=1 Tax=Brachybacterium tyrofermentans TaxID=47848 RepID=UPI0018682FBE|nr:hypothetical protein [Brachybacterium tyrofermentans]
MPVELTIAERVADKHGGDCGEDLVAAPHLGEPLVVAPAHQLDHSAVDSFGEDLRGGFTAGERARLVLLSEEAGAFV